MKDFSEFYDVCICGAGFSGLAAGIKSAEMGLKTLLIAKDNFYGGVVHSAMHQTLCGLYPHVKKTPVRTLNSGLPRELEKSIRASGGKVEKNGLVYVLTCSTQQLRNFFDRRIGRQKNLECCLNASVKSVGQEKNRLTSLELTVRKRKHTIHAHAFIDATGTGEVIRLSGASYEKTRPSKRQLAAYAVRVKGVQSSKDKMLHLRVLYCLAKGIKSGKLKSDHRYSDWLHGQKQNEGVLRISVRPSAENYVLRKIRAQARKIHSLLKSQLSEFKKSEIVEESPQVAERDGIRLSGRYRLSVQDVLSARKFKDGSVKGAWPVEFWNQKSGPGYRYLPFGQYYEIPDRCLISKDFPNLFAAGKCISASAEAAASTRMSATCLALGEASAKLAHSYIRSLRKVGGKAL